MKQINFRKNEKKLQVLVPRTEAKNKRKTKVKIEIKKEIKPPKLSKKEKVKAAKRKKKENDNEEIIKKPRKRRRESKILSIGQKIERERRKKEKNCFLCNR